jgi:hypothetical protein
MKYEPTTRAKAIAWATSDSTLGKMENQSPIHFGIDAASQSI